MARRSPSEAGVQREPLQTRVAPELREKIVEASAKSGRSVAQELEIRLERSFDLPEITTNAMNAAAARMFELMSDLSQRQTGLLLQQCGGDELFLLWQIPAFAIQQVERERGKKIRDDEETRRAAERAVLGVITDVFRNLPPTYSQWKASIPAEPATGESFRNSLAALGQAIYEDKK